MNNIIKRKWNQNSMVIIEDLQGMAFQAESGGHTFQISGIDGEGNAVALSGTPAGVLLRADGQDVALTCSASGGVISATLPANAYSVPGRFGLTIFLTSDGQKTAIYAAVGTVGKTSSGTVAPPAGSDVVDLVNAIAAAVATIPASYTDLMAAMAPTYSSSGLYAVGSYAWYNGKLYRCTTAITSGETWTSGHWTLANLGSDLVDLKSAIDIFENDYYKPFNIVSSIRVVNGYKCVNVGEGAIVDANYATLFFPVVSGNMYALNINNTTFAAFATSDSAAGTFGENYSGKTLITAAPGGANYLVVSQLMTDTDIKIKTTYPIKENIDFVTGKAIAKVYTFNGYLNKNTYRFVSASGTLCKYTDILPCIPGDIFEYQGNANYEAASAVFYNGDNPIGSTQNTFALENKVLIEIPDGVNGVVFSSYTATDDPDDIVFDVVSKFEKISLAEKYAEYVANGIKNLTSIHAGFLTSNGTYSTPATCTSKTTEILPCSPGNVFLYKGKGEQSAVSALFYKGKTITGNAKVKDTSHFNPIVIPANTDGVVFSSYEVTNSASDVVLEVKKGDDTQSVLYGKSIAFEGDSIMAGVGYAGGFGKIIADTYGMTYINNAVGGGVITAGISGRHCISDGISDLPLYDYMIFEGGVNDFAIAEAYGTITLGEISESFNDPQNPTTFCASLEHICYLLRTTYSAKKVGYVFPHRIFYSNNWVNVWKPTIISIFKKWGVPFIDLESIVPPLNFIDSLKAAYTKVDEEHPNGDGWHPNQAGYNQYYVPFITEWLETL